VVVSAGLVVNTLVTDPRDSLLGLGIVLLGLPVYFGMRKK
jgi:hypothetical protein